MKSVKSLWVFILILLLPAQAFAELDIVASSSSTGALVREIAGQQANLTILAPPDRNLHYLQARPNMIRALRRADLVLSLGGDLEVGWLPLAISQSTNTRIQPGTTGYFEAAAQVNLLEVGGPADRAHGDVHPTGNPHVNMDPVRMAEVATALAERLAVLDSQHADTYRARARAFSKRVDERVSTWREQLSNPPGVVSFHKDVIYLLKRLDVPYWGSLEPVPGVPPTASHISTLVNELRGKNGIVLFTTYQSEQAPASLADSLGWKQVRLPLEPPLEADGDAYLDHMQRWIDALAIGS